MIEREELERLVAANAAPLYRYCLYKHGGDEELAAETLSDVWLVLLKKQRTLESGNVRAFLYRTADRCAAHNASSREKRRMKTAPLEKLEEKETAATDEYFADRSGDGLAESLAASLPEDEREIFRLRFVEGKKLEEVAAATGLPYSTLRYRIERIRKRVRTILERE